MTDTYNDLSRHLSALIVDFEVLRDRVRALEQEVKPELTQEAEQLRWEVDKDPEIKAAARRCPAPMPRW